MLKFKNEEEAITSNQLFTEALECERIATGCGPFDPAFEFFKRKSYKLLAGAVIAERMENGGN